IKSINTPNNVNIAKINDTSGFPLKILPKVHNKKNIKHTQPIILIVKVLIVLFVSNIFSPIK
ncbi:MAG: hypothetical protein Q8942_16895, partial [Bacillota bacterium]|nr:hypothetical protein [Bacillota bacterium]